MLIEPTVLRGNHGMENVTRHLRRGYPVLLTGTDRRFGFTRTPIVAANHDRPCF